MKFLMQAGYRTGSVLRTQTKPFTRKPPKIIEAENLDEAFKLACVEWPAADEWLCVEELP
jgi:hypothetical protein